MCRNSKVVIVISFWFWNYSSSCCRRSCILVSFLGSDYIPVMLKSRFKFKFEFKFKLRFVDRFRFMHKLKFKTKIKFLGMFGVGRALATYVNRCPIEELAQPA